MLQLTLLTANILQEKIDFLNTVLLLNHNLVEVTAQLARLHPQGYRVDLL